MDTGAMDAMSAGQDAGRRAYDELSQAGRTDEFIRSWLYGFLSGFMEPPAKTVIERSSSNRPIRPSMESTPSLTARVIDCRAFMASSGTTYCAIGLHVDGMALEYRPGDEAAILPSNTPEAVRDVLRTLRLNPQMRVRTASGAEPIWQVLLERVNLDCAMDALYELMRRSANTRDERESLDAMAKDQDSRSRSLLTLLRRFPRVRPALSDLLQTLEPLSPSIVPIASVCGKGNRFELLVSNDRTLQYGTIDDGMLSRCANGEWLTFAIRAGAGAPNFDSLTPVVFVSDQMGAAIVRAQLGKREMDAQRGRNWVLGLDAWGEDAPYADEALSWKSSGLCRAIDRLPLEQRSFEAAFAEIEESLWRWIVDKSVIYVAVASQPIREQFVERLRLTIAHRGRFDESTSNARLRELEEAERLVFWNHG